MMNLWTAQLAGGWLTGRWLLGIWPGTRNQGAKAATSSGLALPVHVLRLWCSSIHLAFFQSVFLFTFWGGTIPKTDPGGRLCLEVPGLATKGKKTERQKGYTAKWDNNRRAIYLQFKKKKGTFWSLLKQGKTACHTDLILCTAWTSAGPNHSSLPFSPRTRPDSQASCLLTGAGTVPLPPVGLFPQAHREPGASCPLGIRNTASGSYSSAFNCNSWGAPWGAAFLLGFEQRGLHCCFCHRPNAISTHL